MRGRSMYLDKNSFDEDVEIDHLCGLAFRAGNFNKEEALKLLEGTKITMAILKRRLNARIVLLKKKGPINDEEKEKLDALTKKYQGKGFIGVVAMSIPKEKPYHWKNWGSLIK